MSGKIVIGSKDYLDRVKGCWLGKSIGGTLGGPHECKLHVLDLDFYRPVPKEPAPNDDLDLQIVWLDMLEKRGVPPRLADLARWWLDCCTSYPWNEYGFCTRNLNRGLRPPVSGCFENYYVDEMGSPIRSEIWACLAPGNPELAAEMAWKDSMLDHAGGEGMHGEMFWAAVQAAAFVESDKMKLIDIGLAMIPLHSQISRAVRDAVWALSVDRPWANAREQIRCGFQFGDGTPAMNGGPRPCHAAVNHGFTILGWLYGKDFGDRLCKAVNCGYDTDCTGATLGATLGILGGARGIPKRWIKPVGQKIVLHKFTDVPGAPKTIDELTRRTARLARQISRKIPDAGFEFGPRTRLPADLEARLFRNDRALSARARDTHSAVEDRGEIEITFHYGGEPVARPGRARTVGVSLARAGQPVPGEVSLAVPRGWKIVPAAPLLGQARFTVTPRSVADRNVVIVSARAGGRSARARFTILGPGEAEGFVSVRNVDKCPRCGAWVKACVCRGGRSRRC
jgi:ADP-ribosylglycohydrolase